ncbi:hypothetical protein HDU79_011391 [Rhizoclosmatium sp. JEL0117]|nr:hypothetical protein HDU79_011391 [Rhizoclosmatium sp. JEL0117]
MPNLVTGSPFLLSFKNDLSCIGLPEMPTLAHLCLSRPTSASHMTLSAPELSDAYKSANLITFKGSSSVCGSNTDVGDRLNTVLSEAFTTLGPLSSYEYDVYLSGATVSQFYLAYSFLDDFYPCGFWVYNAATQDPKYILSAPPTCGSKFAKTPSSAINPEASCFGALQFDGKTGTASFPWCNNNGPYSESNLAQRYGTSQDKMALYSLGTDKLVVQFANDWSASSDPETLCTLEYHSISLNETSGTFYLSYDYIIIVISDTQIMNSNVGVQVQTSLKKRRDGVKLGANNYMLVYKRGIAPTSTRITSKIVASTVLSRTIFTSTVPVANYWDFKHSIVINRFEFYVSCRRSTTSMASLTTALPSANVSAPASSTASSTASSSFLCSTVSSGEYINHAFTNIH